MFILDNCGKDAETKLLTLSTAIIMYYPRSSVLHSFILHEFIVYGFLLVCCGLKIKFLCPDSAIKTIDYNRTSVKIMR